MVRLGYFSHRSRDGRSAVQRLVRHGYTRRTAGRLTGGENLGWSRAGADTPRSIVRAWMASPAHRRVILMRAFRYAGAASVSGIPVERDAPGTTFAMQFAT